MRSLSFYVVAIVICTLAGVITGCGSSETKPKEDFFGFSRIVPEEAEMNYTKARILWPLERGSSFATSVICSNPKEAIKLLDTAITIAPDYAEAYLRRGLAKSDLNDFHGALLDADKAVQLQSSAEAYAYRGLIYTRSNKLAPGEKDLLYSLSLAPDQYLAWNFLGALHLLQGNDEEACNSFLRACNNGECSRYATLKNGGVCE